MKRQSRSDLRFPRLRRYVWLVIIAWTVVVLGALVLELGFTGAGWAGQTVSSVVHITFWLIGLIALWIGRTLVEKRITRSELRYHDLAQRMGEGLGIINEKEEFAYANPAAERIFGVEPGMLVGRNLSEFLDEENYQAVLAQTALRRDGRGSDYELEIKRADGEPRHVQITASPYCDSTGTYLGTYSLFQDVTTRKKAESLQQQLHEELEKRVAERTADLKRSEERYRTLLERTQEPIALMQGEKLLYANPALCKLLGYANFAELAEIPMARNFAPGDYKQAMDRIRRRIAGEELSLAHEMQLRRKDGSLVWVESTSELREYEGRPAVQTSLHNIDERKRAEEALKESEAKLRELAENIEEVFWVGTPDWQVIHYVSPAYERIWGRSCESLYAKPKSWLDAVVQEDRAALIEALDKRIRGDQSDPGFPEYRVQRPDGSQRWVHARAFPIHDQHGEVYRIAGIAEDVTERKLAEAKLLRIMKAVESASEAIGMSDVPGHHFYQNKAFTELFEYSSAEELEAAGGGPAAYANPDVAREVFETIKRGEPWAGEIEMVAKSGRRFPVYLRANPIKDEDGNLIGLVGVHTDITERKRIVDERERLILELSQALAEVKILRGFLPICARCKKIRDDQGYWRQLEHYISEHSDAVFSHSLCPQCATELYPDVDLDMLDE